MNPEVSQPISNPGDSGATTEKGPAVPMWLIVLTGVMLFLGAIYFESRGAWFDARVYEPFRSAEQIAQLWPPREGNFDQGRLLYSQLCVACHMDNGAGNPGNGCPPLAGSEWVTANKPDRLVRIISKGLTGPIEVKGQTWSTGTMLPIGDQLPGDEKAKAEGIAAIATYIRGSFGNKASPVTAEQVLPIREQIQNRRDAFTAPELLAIPVD